MRFTQLAILISLTILLMALVRILLGAWEEHAGKGLLAMLALLALFTLSLIAKLFFRFVRQSPGD